jgi:hypothetical protein
MLKKAFFTAETNYTYSHIYLQKKNISKVMSSNL